MGIDPDSTPESPENPGDIGLPGQPSVTGRTVYPGRRRGRRSHSFADLKERGNRTRGDEVNYFKVDTVCLGCGARARVKVDKLHGKLRCRSCGTVMHMSRNGTWKLGPPPTLLDDGLQTGGDGEFGQASGLKKILDKYPALRRPSTRWTAAAVLAAVFMLWGARAYFGADPDLPPTLLGRAGVICESVNTNDKGRFEKLLSADGRNKAQQWFAAIRSRLERSEKQSPSTAQFVLRVLYERPEKEGEGCVLATFSSEQKRTKTTVTRRQKLFECALYFVHKDNQGWLLDGKRTHKEM